ncbi:MAG: hypothetical protein R3Y32_06620 [Bacillota bacterium]
MKYEIIKATDNKTFMLDCPIQLIKSMVTREAETGIYYLNVRYFSMAEKDIQTVCLKLSVKSKGAIKINSTYIFQPKNGSGMIQNDKPHPFYLGEYKDVDFFVSKIIFTDGSQWLGSSKPQYSDVPEKADIAKYDKYKYHIDKKFQGVNVKYAFSENAHLWRCVCGCVNQNKQCFSCGCDGLETRNFFDAERLEREYSWWQEKLACDESMVSELETLQETKRYSEIFDAQIRKTKSQSSKDVADAIVTINEIYNEENFLKKVQAEELLARANAKFEERKEAEWGQRHWMASIQNKLAEEKRIKQIKTAKRNKVTAIISTTVLSICVIAVSLFYAMTNYVIPEWQYTSGMESFNNQQYSEAIDIFTELGEYEDSSDMVLESWYQMAVDYIESDDYNSARNVFLTISEYKNSAVYLVIADKMEGEDYLSQGRFEDALEMFALVADEDGVALMQDECYYGLALAAFNSDDIDTALEMFLLANEYSNSEDYIVSIIKTKADAYYQAGDYANLITLLEFRTDDFVATYLAEVVPIYESYAQAYYDNGDYATSKTMYLILANVTDYLGSTASNRVVAYPVFCDARMYANNYDEVVKVFDLSYESFDVIEDVQGYMVQFLAEYKWVTYAGTSTDSSDSTTDRYISVDEDGYATYSMQSSTSGSGDLTYYDGMLYVDGEKLFEMRITSYSSIVFTISKTEYVYARTNG